MPTNRLKPKLLAKLPPGTHGDGHGLALLVKPTGGRSWIQRLVIAGTGKRVAMGLGGYPLVSLAEARAAAIENRRKARTGEDPRKPRLPRFDAVAEMWAKERAKKSWTERPLFENRMTKLIGPKIGRSTIDAVNAAGLREVVDAAGSVSQAKNAIREVGQVLAFAVAHGWRTDNPAPAIQRTISRPAVTHRKHLADWALKRAFWKIGDSDITPVGRVLLMFLCMVPVRTREAREARWEEFDAEDWLIPAERVKNRQPFFLTIPRQAEKLLRDWGNTLFVTDDDDFQSVFALNGDTPPTPKTMTRWKNAIPELREMDLHGIRGTFLSWCAENGESVELGERCLGHKIGTKVTQSYNHHEYREEKAALLQRWADYLTTPNEPLQLFKEDQVAQPV